MLNGVDLAPEAGETLGILDDSGSGLSGEIPSPIDLPSGCHLHQRCPWAVAVCKRACPPLETVSRGRSAACYRTAEMALRREAKP